MVRTKDGVEIFYKAWGHGTPIVFSHGWPLSADDWDAQMMYFPAHGYRVIAHDRRGHGRSSQAASGHDMDHYADDLLAVAEHLDLDGAIRPRTVAADAGDGVGRSGGTGVRSQSRHRGNGRRGAGHPSVPGLPRWPAGGDAILDFTNAGPVAGPDPWKARLDVTDQASTAR